MPAKSVNELVKEAPKGALAALPKERLASLIAGLLSMWNTLYPDESLAKEVKAAWRQQR